MVHGGKKLLVVPPDEWVRFEVACPLGDASTGKFDLAVWLPGDGSPRVFKHLACQEGFERLDWIGLVSKAAEEATFYVDNVEVQPAD